MRIYGVLSLVSTGVTVGLAIVLFILFILFTSLTVAIDLRFRHDSRCVRGKPHNARWPGPSRKTQESSPIVYDVDVMTVGGGSAKVLSIDPTSGSVTTRFDTIFAAMIASCAEFCAGARQGRDIEECYHALDRRSGPGPARLGLARTDIARAALTGTRH